MFAFVIYDTYDKTLYAARDRFGIKPLYYWPSPKGFLAIASEIKQFTVLPCWKASVNGQAAYDFLNWGITNNLQETSFKGVYQLQGGHYFTFKLDHTFKFKIEPKAWYQLPIGTFRGSLQEAGEQFYYLLKDSVKLRCRADVSIGSCLSGGLDSSSIVCLVNTILQEEYNLHPQKTFSAYSHYKRFDESEYIEEIIKHTNVIGHYTYPKLDDLVEELNEIIWHQDEPFGSTSIYAQWEVFKLVKKHQVKVMLDGQGSDEQLAGYTGFHSVRFYELLKNYRLLTLWKELRLCKRLHRISFPTKLLLDQLLPDLIKQPLRKLLKKQTTSAPWLNLKFLNTNERDPNQIRNPAVCPLQKLCYSQVTRTSLPMLLHFEDRDSMAHSIEARTPFLDYRLVEFTQSLPTDYKLSDGVSKQVLRSGLKGVLPEKIRRRISKLAFATPEEEWVRNQHPTLFHQLVHESFDASQGILNKKALQTAEDIISGRIPFNFLLWRLIIFGKWMKRFSVSIDA